MDTKALGNIEKSRGEDGANTGRGGKMEGDVERGSGESIIGCGLEVYHKEGLVKQQLLGTGETSRINE